MKIKLSSLSGGLRQEVKKYMNEGKVRISSFPKPIKESLLSEAKGEYPTVSYLKRDFSTVYGWQNKEVTFRRGTECERADNQPEDKNGAPFYWIREIPQDKLDDEEFVSWFDTYGFKISIDMVTPFSMNLMESSFDEVYVYKKTPKGKSPYPEVPMDSNPTKEASAILAKTVKSFNMDVNKAREAIFDLQRSGGFYIFNKLEPEERNEIKKIMKIYGMMGSEEIPLNENRMYVVYDYTNSEDLSDPAIHGVYSDINKAKAESKKIRRAQGKMPDDMYNVPTDASAKVKIANPQTILKAQMIGRLYA